MTQKSQRKRIVISNGEIVGEGSLKTEPMSWLTLLYPS
jgi:hypothetical protein